MEQKINYYFDDCGVYTDSFPALEVAVAPPDNALWVAPPDQCPDGYAIVARGDKSGWDIVPDYRETGAYDRDGQWQHIAWLGELPEGWTVNPPEPEFTPGPDYKKRDEGKWYKIRYTKKDFLLLCGFDKVIALNAAIKSGNIMAQSIHDLLFAAEYIDVTDPATAQMVQMLATAEAGNVLTAADTLRVLAGELYEDKNENPAG
ncbi:hypothetical protein C4J81_15330 [Deltaproteobacteria bacterium Smac51]|nr:hypothetical protein C4J81_10065 [Deltaproteobacteria bacterium Smac51]UQZ90503.1 hypothetical protein C4J81_15330 [Deltaproteobacteria bacterium Smac51]